MDHFSIILNKVKGIHFISQQQQRIGLLTIATFISACALYNQVFKRPASKDNCPMVPYTDTWKGSSMDYLQDPRAFVEKWTEKLGHVYRVHMFGQMHTIASGKYAREILMSDDFDFGVGTQKKFDIFSMAGIFDNNLTGAIIRNAIVKHLNPHLKEFTPHVVENFTIGFHEILGDVTEPVELSHLMPLIQRMVTRGSATVFIGKTLCKNKNVTSIMQNITTDIGKMHPRYHQSWLMAFPWMLRLYFKLYGRLSQDIKRQRKIMLDALVPEIDKRQADAQNDPNWQRPTDVLQELIEDSALSSGKHGDIYTAVLNQLLILIFASIHTTSENTSITLYRLLQNPSVIDELLQEQEQVLRKAGYDPKSGKNSCEVFTFDIIKNMPRLDSVCRESLRLRSQFFELAHTNIRDHKVTLSNGVIIPSDGDVLINTWHNHHQGGDDIGEFNPFRYVDTGYPATKVGDNYLVFGEGRHACPGRWLAVQEIKTIVSMLIHDYKFHAPEGVVFPPKGSGLPYGKVIIERK
ncbi:cytochrome P450 [Phascolomyces articulosus]|uniref:Cytochrome P450 n=1 Tax=Phascolomyces articulosus TaxID=60185 RepID=A0AAD5JQG7_9FUNG|nr:cytochrome P450 [Phascolomyces articulosus]